MNLDELRAFLAVAETGSVAAAAKVLGAPRASVRRRLDELEARAGAPLLSRGPGGARLTPVGERVAHQARGVLERASALLRSLHGEAGEPSGTLRCLLPVGLPPSLVALLVRRIRDAAPALRFEASYSEQPQAEPPECYDLLATFGEPELGSAWATRRLVTLREWLVASPDYLRARGRPGSLSDLRRHDLLTWWAPGRSRTCWPLLDGSVLPVEPIAGSADVHQIRHLAAAGLGIALVPDAEIPEPGLPEGSLETVLADRVGAVVPLCLSFPVRRAAEGRIRAVQDLVTAFTSEL